MSQLCKEKRKKGGEGSPGKEQKYLNKSEGCTMTTGEKRKKGEKDLF